MSKSDLDAIDKEIDAALKVRAQNKNINNAGSNPAQNKKEDYEYI